MSARRGTRGSPGSVGPLLGRAIQAHQAGDLVTAQALYAKVLRASPRHFTALYALGVSYCQQERYALGVPFLEQALAIRPDVADAHCVISDALNALWRHDEARIHSERALTLDPSSAEACNNLGNAFHALARQDEAIARYEQAIALKPAFAAAYGNLGTALYTLGRYEEAILRYEQALALKPTFTKAHYNLGIALHALGRYEEATASYAKALALQPAYPEALSNLGNALYALGRYEDATASYAKALALQPAFAPAHSNLGSALYALGRPEEALTHFTQALLAQPDFADAEANMSHALLVLGRYAEGWPPYEKRSREYVALERPDLRRPLWLGKEDLAGKTILLHAEQGLGDTIQFCRYAALVARQGARVILTVQQSLRALLADVQGPHQIVSSGDPLPDFDYHCPLLSLPLAFGTRLETIPAPVPYLTTPRDALTKWEALLDPKERPRIGIAWSGRLEHKNDRNRSIPLRRLLPLLTAGVSLVSLHQEVRPEDQDSLDAHPEILHFGGALRDFTDTAALVTLLDLVISVDTSVVHLAGALGRPVWILLPLAPDWRWLLDRTDSPWYPTARLFRQPRIGDWDSVIRTVAEQLAAFAR